MKHTRTLKKHFYITYLYIIIIAIFSLGTTFVFVCNLIIDTKILYQRQVAVTDFSEVLNRELKEINMIGNESKQKKIFSPTFQPSIPGYFFDIQRFLKSVESTNALFSRVVFYDIAQGDVYTSSGMYTTSYLKDSLSLSPTQLKDTSYSFWVATDTYLHYVYSLLPLDLSADTGTCLIFSIPTDYLNTRLEGLLMHLDGYSFLTYGNKPIYRHGTLNSNKPYYALNTSADHNLHLHTFINKHSVIASLWTVMFLFVLITLLIGLICLLISYLSMRKFFTPLRMMLGKLFTKSDEALTLQGLDQAITTLLDTHHALATSKANLSRQDFLLKLLGGHFGQNTYFDNQCKTYMFDATLSHYFCLSIISEPASTFDIFDVVEQSPLYFNTLVPTPQHFHILLGGTQQQLESFIATLHTLSPTTLAHTSIGIGNIVDDVLKLNTSYTLSRHLVKEAQVSASTVLTADSNTLSDPLIQQNTFLWDDFDKIPMIIETRDHTQFKFLISDLRTAITSAASTTFAISLYSTFAFVVYSTLEKQGILTRPAKYYLDACTRRVFHTPYALLGELTPIEKQVFTYLDSQVTHTPPTMIDTILAYIHEHYLESNFSIKMMATELDLSMSYLSNYFKKNAGCTLTQYIDQLRTKKIKELLRSPSLSLQAIADEVGYATPSTLIKNFKKIEGITPGDYRRKINHII